MQIEGDCLKLLQHSFVGGCRDDAGLVVSICPPRQLVQVVAACSDEADQTTLFCAGLRREFILLPSSSVAERLNSAITATGKLPMRTDSVFLAPASVTVPPYRLKLIVFAESEICISPSLCAVLTRQRYCERESGVKKNSTKSSIYEQWCKTDARGVVVSCYSIEVYALRRALPSVCEQMANFTGEQLGGCVRNGIAMQK